MVDLSDTGIAYPNRGDTSKGNALLPLPPVELRGTISTAEHYLSTMQSLAGFAKDFIDKAQAPVPSAYSYARISYMPDANAAGLMAWPGINPESLRKIAKENIVPRLVINQRKADVYRYSTLSQAQLGQPGWRIEMRERDKHPSRAVQNDMRDAERFIQNCSRDYTYTQARERDAANLSPFSAFLAKTIEDLYTYDGWATWTDMNRRGQVNAFTTLPAGNIRLAFPGQGYKGDPDKFAALIDETGNPIGAYTRDELTWKVMSPRTDPDVMGYGWSPIEQAVRLVQAFQGGIDLNADTFCYSEDTEVLTKAGWKRFDAADIAADEFATLNTLSGKMEYQKATDKVWQDYVGEMYTMKSRSLDFVVTPNHRVITQYRPAYLATGKSDYVAIQAKDLYEKLNSMTLDSRRNYCLPAVSEWEGVPVQDKLFVSGPPQYSNTQDMRRSISGDDYCAFMGAYLSEGSTTYDGGAEKDRIAIHQLRKSKGYEPYRVLLTRILGKEPPYAGEDRFYFGWRGLAEHVRQFGVDCYTKRIPQEILDAPPRQQQIFWDHYVLGDGCTTSRQTKFAKSAHDQTHITTTSRVMADQLQELAQKMGFAATICEVDAARYSVGKAIGDHIVRTAVTRYDVYIKMSPMQAMTMEKIVYHGKIGCVSVPNGTLYVRRNGKSIWCGNTRNGIPNGMLLLMGDYWNQDQIDLLQREWQNMKKGQSKVWTVPVLAVPEDGDVKVLPLNDLKGTDIRYKDHLNLMGGMFCAVNCFPVRRLGLFISGNTVDNAPLKNESTAVGGTDDPGLPRDLNFIGEMISEYLIAPNWPHLFLRFCNTDPKSDSREYELRRLSRTWGETRRETDQDPLTSGVKTELKPLAEIMDLMPEDPAKISAFQVLATKYLELMMGGGEENEADGGKDSQPDNKGAPFPSKIDPAESEKHGHTSGVRRNSRAEKESAGTKPQSAMA